MSKDEIVNYVWDEKLLARANLEMRKDSVEWVMFMCLAEKLGLPTVMTPSYQKVEAME